MRKKLTIFITCIMFGIILFNSSVEVHATEATVEITEEISEESTEETSENKDPLDKILDTDPFNEENVEKGKTIFTKIVDAAMPFIKSFLLALYDFFIAVGKAIFDGLKEL